MIKSEYNSEQNTEHTDSSSSPIFQHNKSKSSSDIPTTPIDPKNAKKISKQPVTKRRPRTSHIWNYSTTNPEDGITLNKDGQEVWICSMCKDRKTTYLLSGGTAAPIRHLARVHKIEPCLTHARPRRHTKNLSDSILYANNPNTALYKNDIFQHNFGNPFMPPGIIHSIGPANMPGMVPVMPSHLMQSNPIVSMVAAGPVPHEIATGKESYMFPMMVAGPTESNYTGSATPLSNEFINNPYGMQLQPSMPLSSSQFTASSAIATTATSVPVLRSENGIIEMPLSSVPSTETSVENTNTPKTNISTKLASATKADNLLSSTISTPQTHIASTVHGSAVSAISSPGSPLSSYPETTNKKQQQQSAQALTTATGINIDAAVNAFMEMVSNYEVPASLIDSDCFKRFCTSLNPNAVGDDVFASLKANFRTKSLSSTSPTPSAQTGAAGSNYTYLSAGVSTTTNGATVDPSVAMSSDTTNSAQNGYLNNTATVYSNGFAMTTGLGETLVQPQSQTYQSEFIW